MEALSAACRVPTAEHLKKPPMRRWKSSLSQKLPPSRLNRTGSNRLMLSTDYSSELPLETKPLRGLREMLTWTL